MIQLIYPNEAKTKRKPSHRERSVAIQVRVTEKEKRHIEALARSVNLTVSELIRQITGELHCKSIPPEEYFAVRGELHSIWLWMNNAYRRDGYRADFEKYLAQIENCADKFREVADRFYTENGENLLENYYAVHCTDDPLDTIYEAEDHDGDD